MLIDQMQAGLSVQKTARVDLPDVAFIAYWRNAGGAVNATHVARLSVELRALPEAQGVRK